MLQEAIVAVRFETYRGVALIFAAVAIDGGHWLALVQRELLLFAGVFFLIGAIDDIALDLYWLFLRLRGKASTPTVDTAALVDGPLAGQAAVFIPTWSEHEVVTDTIKHALSVWKHRELTFYVGCYRNDPRTIDAVMRAAPNDPRLRLVIHDCDGPSTKADCLNRLYLALMDDEQRSGIQTRMVVFHDAEDMVDEAALGLLDRAIGDAEFVQLPVMPLPQRRSRFVGSHYCEEFAESHAKAMVVRDALGVAIPAAGVGCAVARAKLDELALSRNDRLPFASDSLTEDYELGLSVAELGGKGRFIRARHEDGRLIATRAYFPATIEAVVRQKTRWVHGIALQGWDRIAWTNRPAEVWMRLRDRRGPITALVLVLAYGALAVSTLAWAGTLMGLSQQPEPSSFVRFLLAATFFALIWRVIFRFAFTARDYGMAQGFLSIVRMPIANIIAIMAGRRAVAAYLRTLSGEQIVWDKTRHDAHPARIDAAELFA